MIKHVSFNIHLFLVLLLSVLSFFSSCKDSTVIVVETEDGEYSVPDEDELSDKINPKNENKEEVEDIYPVIAQSNYRTSTHWMKSGGLELGITNRGGGIINQIKLDGVSILAETAQRYGRACQFAARDQGHAGVYNPTQAGYYETLGTPCTITETDNKMTIEPRPCSLWHGDGKYDFCEWENIGNDPYSTDGIHGGAKGHGSDVDGIDETNLVGKQYAEVGSEFDFFGEYENYMGKYGIDIAAVRFYFELRYIRKPGHCISQFYNGKTKDGVKVTNPNTFQSDISVNYPEGVHKGTRDDLNGFIGVYALRYTYSKWVSPYRYLQKTNGDWVISSRDTKFRTEGTAYRYHVIVAESDNEETGKALCLYRPDSDINTNSTIGVDIETSEIVYKDARPRGRVINDEVASGGLVKIGFNDWTLGILNPNQLAGSKYENCYEAYREEYFILYGTPKQIKETIAILDNELVK